MGDLLLTVINKVIEIVGSVLVYFINLLPPSPFSFNLSSVDNSFFKFIMWIIPIQEMIVSIELFLSAVLTFYGIRVAMRWIKLL